MLGDLRDIFLTAESAPLAARFRPHRNLANPVNPVIDYKRVEILSEKNGGYLRRNQLVSGRELDADKAETPPIRTAFKFG